MPEGRSIASRLQRQDKSLSSPVYPPRYHRISISSSTIGLIEHHRFLIGTNVSRIEESFLRLTFGEIHLWSSGSCFNRTTQTCERLPDPLSSIPIFRMPLGILSTFFFRDKIVGHCRHEGLPSLCDINFVKILLSSVDLAGMGE